MPTTNKHGVCFVLAICLWAQCLPWSVADIPNDAPLGKSDFPFPSIYQLQTLSWLGVGCISASPSHCWGFVLFEPMQVLCVLSQSLSSMCLSIIVSKRCVLGVIYQVFEHPFPHRSLNLDGKGLIKTSHLILSAPQFLTLRFSVFGSLCQLPSTERRNFSDEGKVIHWSMGRRPECECICMNWELIQVRLQVNL